MAKRTEKHDEASPSLKRARMTEGAVKGGSNNDANTHTRWVDRLYTEGWTEEFWREADVELIVEGVTLEAHSTILCQSEVLQGAIRDTENKSGRVKIESLFEGTTVEDVDLLLSHLYSTSQVLSPFDLETSKRLLDVAMKSGFDGLVERVLGTLTLVFSKPTDGHFSGLREEWMEKDPDTIMYWLNICLKTSHQKLEGDICKFLATSGFFFLSGEEWNPVRQYLLEEPRLLLKILNCTSQILKRKNFGGTHAFPQNSNLWQAFHNGRGE